MTIIKGTTELSPFAVEVRGLSEGDGRTMTALLVPYGEVSMTTEHRGGERFMRGAFRHSIKLANTAKRPMRLFRSHDHDRPIGTALELRDTEAGPLGTFRIADTTHGRQALEELREGLLPQVSVGFRTLKDKMTDGVRDVVEAALAEVSLTPLGAYDGAEVLSLREPVRDLSWVTLPPMPEVDPSRPIGLWR